MATRSPSFSTSAARRSSASAGTSSGGDHPRLLGVILNSWPGASYSSSWKSEGMMMQVGARSARAMRMARSTSAGNCWGTVAIWK
ncbi:hypothetical protein BH18ACT1_BH18ACT1_16340 [soil metagenome]